MNPDLSFNALDSHGGHVSHLFHLFPCLWIHSTVDAIVVDYYDDDWQFIPIQI